MYAIRRYYDLYRVAAISFNRIFSRLSGLDLERASDFKILSRQVVNELISLKEYSLFFRNFEYIVSKIFHTRQRTIWESITTYWTLLTLTPMALIASFYITGKVHVV